jgi:hypothetical protein
MKNFKPDKRLARLAPPADSRGPKGVARAAGLHQRTYHPLNAPPAALAGNALLLPLETPPSARLARSGGLRLGTGAPGQGRHRALSSATVAL